LGQGDSKAGRRQGGPTKFDHRWADYADAQLQALLDALENRIPTLEIDGEARELDTPPE